MKKRNFVFALAVGTMLAFTSCETKQAGKDDKEIAEEQNDANLGDSEREKDAEFAVDAADAGLYEVQVGTLAITKATSPRVKAFAQMMVDDHTKANNELKTLAGQKGIALPDVISEKCQEKYYDLDQKAKGKDFDKAYMEQMVKDHKDAIDEFEKESDNGNDPDIKAFASSKLTALRHHLAEAEKINDELKGKTASVK